MFTTVALADLKKPNEKPLARQQMSREYPIADPNYVDMITDADESTKKQMIMQIDKNARMNL